MVFINHFSVNYQNINFKIQIMSKENINHKLLEIIDKYIPATKTFSKSEKKRQAIYSELNSLIQSMIPECNHCQKQIIDMDDAICIECADNI